MEIGGEQSRWLEATTIGMARCQTTAAFVRGNIKLVTSKAAMFVSI